MIRMPWYYQPVTSQQFMRGFDRFAWPTVDAARAYIKTKSADEQARMKIYKRSFSSEYCIIHDPMLHLVIGKKRCLWSTSANWIFVFAIPEN